jgi:Sec-independent protein translocase protein TatA
MKRYTGLIAVILFIALLVFFYLQIGKKGADAGATYTGELKGYANDAQKSMNDMNKSIEDAQKAANRALGR